MNAGLQILSLACGLNPLSTEVWPNATESHNRPTVSHKSSNVIRLPGRLGCATNNAIGEWLGKLRIDAARSYMNPSVLVELK
jgi:hypothetical protein